MMWTRGMLVAPVQRLISCARLGVLLFLAVVVCNISALAERVDPPALTDSPNRIILALPPPPPIGWPDDGDRPDSIQPPEVSNTPFFDSGVLSVIEMGSIEVAVQASNSKSFAVQYTDLIAGDEPFTPGLFTPYPIGRIDKAPPFPGINWSKTVGESLLFLGIMHGYRMIIEPDTRAALTGKFWHDYINSISKLRGWSDGDSFVTNYVGHPMMGATAGRILIQNDSRGRALDFDLSKEYLKSRLKAFGYAALFSSQFEIGLISEGTIGNATPNQYTNHPFSYQDFIITPTIGTVWLVGEDVVDKYVVRQIEQWTTNRNIRCLARTMLNPTRSLSNMLRFKAPWYRDGRRL